MDLKNDYGIKYFTVKEIEQHCSIDKVDIELIKALDEFRHKVKKPVLISPVRNSIYATTGHAGKSWHYIIPGRNEKSKAADIFVLTEDFYKAYQIAIKCEFIKGLGVYPYWKYQYKKTLIKGGFHIDVRTDKSVKWWQDNNKKYFCITGKDKTTLEQIIRSECAF